MLGRFDSVHKQGMQLSFVNRFVLLIFAGRTRHCVLCSGSGSERHLLYVRVRSETTGLGHEGSNMALDQARRQDNSARKTRTNTADETDADKFAAMS